MNEHLSNDVSVTQKLFSFSPTDEKFATCGDDGYIKVWDFEQCKLDISLSGMIFILEEWRVIS